MQTLEPCVAGSEWTKRLELNDSGAIDSLLHNRTIHVNVQMITVWTMITTTTTTTTAMMSDFLYNDDDWRFERVSWLLWRLIKR